MLNFNDLSALRPEPVKVVVRDRELSISELEVGETRKALPHLRVIYGLFNVFESVGKNLPDLDDQEAVVAFVGGLSKELLFEASQVVLSAGVEALAIFLKVEPEWLEELNWAELGVLAFLVFKRNYDFFVMLRGQLTLTADDKALLKTLLDK